MYFYEEVSKQRVDYKRGKMQFLLFAAACSQNKKWSEFSGRMHHKSRNAQRFDQFNTGG